MDILDRGWHALRDRVTELCVWRKRSRDRSLSRSFLESTKMEAIELLRAIQLRAMEYRSRFPTDTAIVSILKQLEYLIEYSTKQ